MYVRFVTGTDAEAAAWLTGVFSSARLLRDRGELYQHEMDVLERAFEWFNVNLPCPPFSAKLDSREWTRDAVAWFRADARDLIDRIWDIVFILREHGTPVRMLRSENPGKIVYSDAYQVVAETPRWGLLVTR